MDVSSADVSWLDEGCRGVVCVCSRGLMSER